MTTKPKKAVKAKPKQPVKKESENKLSGLTMKEKIFCENYIYDWNATRSYLVAYPTTKNADTAAVLAHRKLRKGKVQSYIAEIQADLEKIAGISRKRVLDEHIKLAFSSMADMHNSWIERKKFEELSDTEKACISEISTQVRTVYQEEEGGERIPLQVEFVKIKLYDKQKALDSISKMLGYDAPVKTELTGKDGKPLISSIQIEIINNAAQVKKDDPGR